MNKHQITPPEALDTDWTAAQRPARNILITGGAGFVGSNLAERLLAEPGTRITIFDNLSRGGAIHNLKWLHSLPNSERLSFIKDDIRDVSAVKNAARNATEIYHLAAQVAVTTSIDDPRSDFDVNVAGTLNILEAARQSGHQPFVLFTSTNKVYGSLDGVPVSVEGTYYRACDTSFRGVSENEPLDFHSPYGCSKGAADQYVRDYARIYDLPTVVFRMSCIAGPRQFGTEDQGWVAHFLYSVLEGRPITIYGDGRQVRDVLHVKDLLDAMQVAYVMTKQTRGQIYNLGGGMDRSMSVLEMLHVIEGQTGITPKLRFKPTRPGDQPLYVSDTSRLTRHTGWRARMSCAETLEAIHRFWRGNRDLLALQREGAILAEVGELVGEEAG